jgi:hypothetical protein
MFDPGNDLRWTGGITASRPAQPGPLVPGAAVERTARFLGRSFTYGYVVTRHEPDRLVELTVDRPFPMLVRYELTDAEGGTQTCSAWRTYSKRERQRTVAGEAFGPAVLNRSTPTYVLPGRMWEPVRTTKRWLTGDSQQDRYG